MKIPSLFTLIILTLIPFTLNATNIVTWGQGSDILSSDANMSGGWSSALSLGTLRNPTVSSNYYPNANGFSPGFYGASTHAFKLKNENPDCIDSRANGITQTQMVVLWTKEYFLNEADTASNVELSGLSRNLSSNSGAVAIESRYVIRLGTSFYISQITGELTDPSAVTWYYYDPATSYTSIDDSVGNTASLSSFSGLTAVGIYINATRSSAGTIQAKLRRFQADVVDLDFPGEIETVNDFQRDYSVFDARLITDGSVLMRVRDLEHTAGARIGKSACHSVQDLAAQTGVTITGKEIVIENNFVGTNGGWLENYNLEGYSLEWKRSSSCLIRNCYFGEGNDGWINSDGIVSGGTGYLYIRNGSEVVIHNNTVTGKGDYRGKSYGILMDFSPQSFILSRNRFTGIPGDQMVFYGTTVEPALIEYNYHVGIGAWQPEDVLAWDPNQTYNTGDLVEFPRAFAWPNGKVSGGGTKLTVAKVDGLSGYSMLPQDWRSSNSNWYCPDPHSDGYNLRQSEVGVNFVNNYMSFRRVNAPFWLTPNTNKTNPMYDIVLDGCVVENEDYNGKVIGWNPQNGSFNGLTIRNCFFYSSKPNKYFAAAAHGQIHRVENCTDLNSGQLVSSLPAEFFFPALSERTLGIAEIPLSGTAYAPVGRGIEARVVDEFGNQVQDWYEIAQVNADGSFDGVLKVGAMIEWLRPELRVAGTTEPTVTTTNRFGTGIIVLYSEQSNMERVLLSGSASIETIGSNGHDFQYFDLENRGAVTESDENATVDGPIFVTDANPRTPGLSSMAAAYHQSAPGVKVAVLFDSKPGNGQNYTLNDSVYRRSWHSIEKLLSRGAYDDMGALQDGQEVGAFVMSHLTGTDISAEYRAAVTLGIGLDGLPIPGIDPTGTFPDVTVGDTFNHIWAEAMPGILTGRTLVLLADDDYVWNTTSYPDDPGENEYERSEMLRLFDYFPSHFAVASYGGGVKNFDGGTDGNHFDTDSIYGAALRGSILAGKVLQQAGFPWFGKPSFDIINWTPNYVEVGSTMGPVTTRWRSGGNSANFQGGDAEVLGFQYDDFSMPSRVEIVDANGDPADSGLIRIYAPNGETFDGASRLYYGMGGIGVNFPNYQTAMNDLLLAHLPVLDVGLGGRLIEHGWVIQPFYNRDTLNDANDLSGAADGFVVNTTTPDIPWAGVHVFPFNKHRYYGASFTNEFTFEARLTAIDGRGTLLLGASNLNNAYTNRHSIRLNANGEISIRLTNNAGNDLINTPTTGLGLLPGVTATLRIEYEGAADEVRVYLDDTLMQTFTGNDVTQGWVRSSDFDFIPSTEWPGKENNELIVGIEYMRMWAEVGSNGNAPTNYPMVGVEAMNDSLALLTQAEYAQ